MIDIDPKSPGLSADPCGRLGIDPLENGWPTYNLWSMVYRVFAFLFALVLFGSGLTATQRVHAIERATPSSTTVLASVGAVDRIADPAESSELRLLDDRAAAGHQAETVLDVQAVLTDRAPEPASGLTMARPRPPTAPTRLAPYLDGPQRPPCATAFIA